MKCNKCFSEWNTEKYIDKCPFCGNTDKQEAFPEFSSVDETLRYLIETYGQELFLSPQRTLSLFSDFAPALTKERRLIKLCFDSEIIKMIMDNCDEDDEEKKILFSRYAAKLKSRYLINDEWAENCIGWLTKAFGWKGKEEALQKVVLNSGEVYEGEVKDGKPNGKGKITYPAGHVLECVFVNGLPNGKGVIEWNFDPNNYPDADNNWSGEWKDGKPWRGKGTYIIGDFDEVTTVPFVDGKNEGRGIIIRKNGEKYAGGIKNGEYSGTNCWLKKPNGSIFIGEFENGEIYNGFEFNSENKLVARFGRGYPITNI